MYGRVARSPRRIALGLPVFDDERVGARRDPHGPVGSARSTPFRQSTTRLGPARGLRLRGCLDQLGQRPVHGMRSARSKLGGMPRGPPYSVRGRCRARPRPSHELETGSLAALDHVGTSLFDEPSGFGLAAAHCHQSEPVIGSEGTAGELRCLFDGVVERRGRCQLARKDVHLAAVAKGDREIAERAGLADKLEVSIGESPPCSSSQRSIAETVAPHIQRSSSRCDIPAPNARCVSRRIGAAAAYVSVRSATRPSSRSSSPRGFRVWGAAFAASATSGELAPGPASGPAKIAAVSASRYVSRASSGSSGSKPLGGSEKQRRGVVAARSRRTRSVHAAARPRPARARRAQLISAVATKRRASSSAPACSFAWAARKRCALNDATPRASTPWRARGTRPRPAKPPRACARAAERSSSAGDLLVGRRTPPAHGARRGDPGRSPDRSRPPARGGPSVARSARPLRTRPSARADDGTSPRRRAPAGLRLDRLRGRLRDPELPRSSPQKRGSPSGSAAAKSSNRRASRGSRASRRAKLSSIPVGQRQRRGQAEAAGELGGGQPARELQERERVAARLGTIRSSTAFVQPRRRGRTRAAPARRGGPDGSTRSSANPARVPSELARREHHRDPLGKQAAGDEREHARRGAGRATARRRRRTGAAARSAASDNRPRTASPTRNGFGARPALSPKRDAKRVALGSGRRSMQLENRRAQTVGAPRNASSISPSTPAVRTDTKVRRRIDRVLEQRGLADAWLAVHHQHAAVAVPRGLQQAVEHVALALPAEQCVPWGRRNHPEHHATRGHS